MKKMKALSKRGLALLVALLMCATMLPLSAFAAEGDAQPVEVQAADTQTMEAQLEEAQATETQTEEATQPVEDQPSPSTALTGTVTSITEGGKVEGNQVTFGSDATLEFVADGNDAGRAPNYWWAGIKVTPPEGSDISKYRKVNQWWTDKGDTVADDAWTEWATNDDQTYWAIVDPTFFDQFGDTLTYRYQFDWDGDDTSDQEVVIKVTKDVTLNYNGEQAAKVGNTLYPTLQAAITAAGDNATVVLLKNVTENVTAKDKTITLNLNGKTVNGGQQGTVLTINGGSVTLTGNGTITGGKSPVYTQGGGVTVTGDGKFTMKSGKIDHNTANQYGGGVMVYHGTFTMDGGTITSNTTSINGTGGGVMVYNCVENQTAQFTMNGGIISGNIINGSGGGVGAHHWRLSANRTSVIINGGMITGNTATNGGGVSVSTADSGGTKYRGQIDINGGTITGNTANQGGGVYSAESITNISSATITQNTAKGANGFGGGVYVQGGEATIAGAEITGNSAKTGGGLFAGHKERDTTVTMTSGKLYGNTANSAPDAFCNNLTTLTLPNAASMGGMLDGKVITDWYWSSSGQYVWNKDYCVTQDMSAANAKKTQRYLIAAYDLRDPVAKIVETGIEYTTLQAAVEAARNNQTVELLSDATIQTVKSGKTAAYVSVQNKGITVDLAGHTASGGYLWLYGTAQLTVKDSSEAQTGKIDGAQSYAIRVSGGAGTLNVTGGTITGTYGIYAQSGTSNVTGGTITGTYGIYAQSGIAHISGNAKVAGNPAVITTGTATVNVFDNAVIEGTNYGIQAQLGGHLNVYGNAKVSGSKVAVYVRGAQAEAAPLVGDSRTKATIGGNCVIEGEGYAVCGNGNSDGTVIEITGGTIEGGTTALYHPQVGDLTISGGEITGQNGVQYSGAGNLTITGGKITATAEYTEFPQKSPEQNDGTIFDGAALSMVSRGSGYQSNESQVMNVTVTGGEFISEHNSAVAVYRIKQLSDKTWTVGDATELPSYLTSLTIAEGKDEQGKTVSIPVFTGNSKKGVLDIDTPAMEVLKITGGTFSEDVDDTTNSKPNYVADTYESHPVSQPAGYFNVHTPGTAEDWTHDTANHWHGCSGHVDCLVKMDGETPHNFTSEVTTQPQVGVPGVRTYTCGDCGYNYNESIPALSPSNPVDPPVATTYTVRYTDGVEDEVIFADQVNAGLSYGAATPAFRGEEPIREGYTFGGWEPEVSPTVTRSATYTAIWEEEIIDPQTPLIVAPGLDTENHLAYINGYGGRLVKPQNNITRAEVATIFYRLMEDSFRSTYWTNTNVFTDVNSGDWFNNAVSTSVDAELIKGYGDGTFKGNKAITRAEFATIAARFIPDIEGNVEDYPDTANHWAAKEIRIVTEAGWFMGDSRGFRPNDPITRAEAMTVVNRMVNRVPGSGEDLLDGMVTWDDNNPGDWYYEAVQEATNSHNFEHGQRGDETEETWTELIPNPDWKALEKEWEAEYLSR